MIDYFCYDRRKFELRLRRDITLFSNGLSYDNDASFHPSNIYEGKLKGRNKVACYGFCEFLLLILKTFHANRKFCFRLTTQPNGL